jgi:hypothetical protein
MFIRFKQLTETFVIILSVLISISYAAQDQPQRMSVENQIKVLKNRLNLNNGQIRKIKFILEDQREEMALAYSENRGNSQAIDEAVKEISNKMDSKIKEILTEKQIEVYNKIIEERKVQVIKK